MFYKKKGKPKQGEIVICTVKKISFHSVFVILDEYMNVEGMVHISEISPGRIRNLRDYVKEGKTIVCKVLLINPKTGNIDLSLRRVGTGFMVKKLAEHKQDMKAEKFLEMIGKEVEIKLPEMYKKFAFAAIEKYGSLHEFFQMIVAHGEEAVKEFNIEEKIKKVLIEQVLDKIKPTEIIAEGILKLTSYEGVETVKKILKGIEKEGGKVTYLGAPKYKIEFVSQDKKEAFTDLDSSIEKAIKAVEKNGVGEFKKGGRDS